MALERYFRSTGIRSLTPGALSHGLGRDDEGKKLGAVQAARAQRNSLCEGDHGSIGLWVGAVSARPSGLIDSHERGLAKAGPCGVESHRPEWFESSMQYHHAPSSAEAPSGEMDDAELVSR